jgi:fatty acid synthase, animal type
MFIQDVIESEPTLASDVAIVTNQKTETYLQHVGDCGVRVIAKDASKGPIEQNCHLAIGYDLLTVGNGDAVLKNLKDSVKDDGFVLLDELQSAYKKVKILTNNTFTKNNLTVISEQVVENRVVLLIRQPTNLNDRDKQIVRVTENNFNWVEELKESLIASQTGKFTYIVCEGEELFGAVGLMNCIKNEAGGRLARMFFIQDKNLENFTFNSKTFDEQLKKDLIQNVYKNGQWGSFRHLKLDGTTSVPTLPVEHAYVNALTKGDLASLKWIEGPLSHDRPDSKDSRVDLCTVYYAPINFRDVMLSSGKLAADALPGDLAQQDCILGLEFSGRDSRGKRIMAMVQAKSLATTCVAQRNMMWEIPDNWTMEEASTIPCVYSTVYYALVIRGKMKKGESILIHAGSGGVGQAAISVALHAGLNVFTTVGSKEKRDYLKKTFPKVNLSFH